MIMRISSAFVPEDTVEAYLDDLSRTVIPLYSKASGLASVAVLRRQLVAYGEVAIVSAWDSREAMLEFFNSTPPPSAASLCAVILREPLSYELVLCA